MFNSAEDYDRFMGRYSVPLSRVFADAAGADPGQTALDVGCGPGALTGELVRRLGAGAVSAVDPSPQFVAATTERHPGVDVRSAAAENLPFTSETFDVVLAQLVVHFMSDPIAGLSEMKRVARKGGVVAACVWDFTRDQTPLSVFWDAARRLDPSLAAESNLPGTREGDLGVLFASAGIGDVEEKALEIDVNHPDFDDWWEPFTLGVGPAGAYIAGLSPERRESLREGCRSRLPDGSFVFTSRAWAAFGHS